MKRAIKSCVSLRSYPSHDVNNVSHHSRRRALCHVVRTTFCTIAAILTFAFLASPARGEREVAAVVNGETLDSASFNIAFLSSPESSCSGVVVSSRHIITAGHCVDAFRGLPVNIAAKGRLTTAIARSRHRWSDIGIITTRDRLPGPAYGLDSRLYPRVGQVVRVFGFGLPSLGQLTSAYLTIVGVLNSEMFLAYGGATAPCQGDSGGPAAVLYRGRAHVIGIVSAGYGQCSVGTTTTFVTTSGPVVYKWLRRVMAKRIPVPPKIVTPAACGKIIKMRAVADTGRGGELIWKSYWNREENREQTFSEGNHSQKGAAFLVYYKSSLVPRRSSIRIRDVHCNLIATMGRYPRCTNLGCGEHESWYLRAPGGSYGSVADLAGKLYASTRSSSLLIELSEGKYAQVKSIWDNRAQYP